MEQAMVVILLTLLKGFKQEQILLPPGPINEKVGASVLFTALPSTQSISAIKWHFNGIDFITYNNPGPENVLPPYQGRVVLDFTSGTLNLQDLNMDDSGRYTITVTFTNGLGIANYTSLQVFEPVISLGISGPTGNLIEYDTANFTCKGNGTVLTTMWLKDNKILDSSSSITFLHDNRTIMMSPLMRSDSGKYQCVLSNPVSSSTARYNVLVNYGPDVRIFGLHTFEEGSDILLFCLAYSEPYATLRWTVNGEPVRDGDLYIRPNSGPGDSGTYNCTCWNNVTGITDTALHYVTVRAVSSRLAPGAEAGITLGVVIGMFMIFVAAYFLTDRFKKSPPPRETHSPTMSDQPSNKIIFNNMGATISSPTQITTRNTPGRNNEANQPIYVNRTPTPPPRNLPPLPRDRPTNLKNHLNNYLI